MLLHVFSVPSFLLLSVSVTLKEFVCLSIQWLKTFGLLLDFDYSYTCCINIHVQVLGFT